MDAAGPFDDRIAANGIVERRHDDIRLKPKTENIPTGVKTIWDMVWLAVGVTVKTPCLDVVPPKVATRLATNGAKSSGAT